MAITQTITPLPAAPDPSMSEEDFDATATEFTAALPPLVSEINALAAQINSTAIDIYDDATAAVDAANAALSSKNAAATSATTATTKATAAATSEANALTSKNAAATSATNAANSATAAAASVNPVGTVIFYAKSTVPTGYLKANGAAISRTSYAALFAVLGTVFGAGDGSTTFNLPDLRGEFLRAVDDGRGVDDGRVIGSAQSDQFKSHNHGLSGVFNGTSLSVYAGQYPVAGIYGSFNWSDGGSETRPRNIALLACIKY